MPSFPPSPGTQTKKTPSGIASNIRPSSLGVRSRPASDDQMTCGSTSKRSCSLPWQQRDVNDVLRPLVADRLNSIFGFREPERMRRYELERKAVRGKLLEGQLTGAVAVSTGAL